MKRGTQHRNDIFYKPFVPQSFYTSLILKNGTMGVLQSVLLAITPNEQEVLLKVDRILKKLNNELKRQKIRARAVAGGSIAKGTFLKDDHDCDIFVKFDYFYKFHDISRILEVVLQRCFRNVTTLHGSRDYFEVKGDLRYEIIPVLDIYDPNNAANVTDCSPLHVQWVKNYPQFRDEIRLSKAFCKAHYLYGAESYIAGFSGHVLDILTIHAGGFLNLLKASQRWKEGDVIDPNKVYSSKEQALSVLTDAKTQSALIVIDPVQPLRNAAAALGTEKFEGFRAAAKEFLKHQSVSAFVKKPFSIADVKQHAKKNTLFVFTAIPQPGKTDVQGAKVVKCLDYFCSKLQEHGFEILSKGWDWTPGKPATLYITVPPVLLSEYLLLHGPPKKEREHVKMFRERHQVVIEKKNRLYAKEPRLVRNPVSFVTTLLHDPILQEKVQKISLEVLNPVQDAVDKKKEPVQKKSLQKKPVHKKSVQKNKRTGLSAAKKHAGKNRAAYQKAAGRSASHHQKQAKRQAKKAKKRRVTPAKKKRR